MELVKIAAYSLLLMTAIFLTLFNLLFSIRLNSAHKIAGFDIPKFVKRAFAVNTFICLTGTFVAAYALINALIYFKMPIIL